VGGREGGRAEVNKNDFAVAGRWRPLASGIALASRFNGLPIIERVSALVPLHFAGRSSGQTADSGDGGLGGGNQRAFVRSMRACTGRGFIYRAQIAK
jgi:hypothetical protein